MNPTAKKNLNKILSDNKSGSTELLLKLIKWCKANSADKNNLKEMTVIVSSELKSFSAVQSFVKHLKKELKVSNKLKIEDYLNEEENKIKNRYSDLFTNALHYLKDCKKIVTLSNSKTILELLKKLNEHHNIYVIIGESRPQFEGRVLAKELLKNKIKVEILPESLLTNAVEKSDAAVIGVDTILSNGNIVNKIGSRSLALSCKYFNKPLYVLTTADKFSKRKRYFPEKRNEKEIWNYKHHLLKRTNFYFEVVEKKLITKIIKDEQE